MMVSNIWDVMRTIGSAKNVFDSLYDSGGYAFPPAYTLSTSAGEGWLAIEVNGAKIEFLADSIIQIRKGEKFKWFDVHGSSWNRLEAAIRATFKDR